MQTSPRLTLINFLLIMADNIRSLLPLKIKNKGTQNRNKALILAHMCDYFNFIG
jgi:hypothetical protein